MGIIKRGIPNTSGHPFGETSVRKILKSTVKSTIKNQAERVATDKKHGMKYCKRENFREDLINHFL